MCLSFYLIFTGLLVCTGTPTQAAWIVNTLRALIARYVFTRACCMHHLSSSNSPVPVRIGNHTCKCTALDASFDITFITIPLSQFNLLTTASVIVTMHWSRFYLNMLILEVHKKWQLYIIARLLRGCMHPKFSGALEIATRSL